MARTRDVVAAPGDPAPGGTAPTERRLRELAFVHDVAQLATQARDWDELMRAIVDGTTTALGVEVCSFYLADRDQPRLTLAATNGLDRSQVGRVSLGFGEGITGRVADSRKPIAVEDVTVDPRFAWVRGFDVEGLHAMLSVPLVWHDRVIGVLNVQTRDRRRFGPEDVELLLTIGALLAGIVEKGRLQAEIEGRLAELTALDAARADLMSVVTHELRTPLAVVRAYVELLGDAAANPAAGEWQASALEQVSRLDHLVDSILASVRGEGLTGLARNPFDAVAAVDDTVETLRLLLRGHPIRWQRPATALVAIGDPARFKQVLEQLLENESKYVPIGRRREHRRLAGGRDGLRIRHRRRAGRPGRGLGERLRAVRPDRGPGTVARIRDRAVRGAAADGRDGRPRLARAERLRREPVRRGAAGGLSRINARIKKQDCRL